MRIDNGVSMGCSDVRYSDGEVLGIHTTADNKVWIENVEKNVKGLADLSKEIYKIPWLLSKHGAEFEIGPSIPSKFSSFLNGLYCTNLSEKEVREIINSHDFEKELDPIKSSASNARNDMDKASLPEVESIFESIKSVCENYYLACSHGLLFGIDVNDILDSVIDEFENLVIPSVNGLSTQDKQSLLALLQNMSNCENMDLRFAEKIKELLNEALGISMVKKAVKVNFGKIYY